MPVFVVKNSKMTCGVLFWLAG